VSASGKEEFECPSCKGLVEEDWQACPHCGVVYDDPAEDTKATATSVVLPAPSEGPSARVGAAPARSAAPEQAAPPPHTHLTAATAEAPALPSVDTGELPFSPSGAGPKRPITVMDERASPASGPSMTLDALISRDKTEDRIPPPPPSDVGRKAVTMVHEITPIHDLAPPAPAETGTLIDMPAPGLASTVVVVAPEPPATPARRLNDDLAAIERMINAAVAKAVRENIAALALQQPAAQSGAATTATQRKGALAVGAGLLLGGAIGELTALNWDTWIRGLGNSVIGPLQQLGVIGMAILAGAGGAVVVLQAGRSRHRAKGRAKSGAPRAH